MIHENLSYYYGVNAIMSNDRFNQNKYPSCKVFYIIIIIPTSIKDVHDSLKKNY